MLEIIAIASVAIVVSTLLVWLYRRIFAWQGVNYSLESLSRRRKTLRLSSQQGFVRAMAMTGSGKRNRKVDSVKRPWGW